MISLFTEPLHQLSPEHVETLFAENVPEGQTVEFKQTAGADEFSKAIHRLLDDLRNECGLSHVEELILTS